MEICSRENLPKISWFNFICIFFQMVFYLQHVTKQFSQCNFYYKNKMTIPYNRASSVTVYFSLVSFTLYTFNLNIFIFFIFYWWMNMLLFHTTFLFSLFKMSPRPGWSKCLTRVMVYSWMSNIKSIYPNCDSDIIFLLYDLFIFFC